MSKYAASAPLLRALPIALLAATSLVGFSSQALAAEDDEEEAEELTEVQVTGTRIQNPNVTSANPITSITGDEMRALGYVNVADALTMLVPQNISTYMPTLTGDDQIGTSGSVNGIPGGGGMEQMDRGSFFIGNTIANLRGLDPTYGTRTLTLIDGRRQVSSSNQADVVDLNVIPSNLLQRMDVVTGGASATYGSGAMAGVVNLVLNNRMQGINVDVDYGVNEAGDGGSPHVSISGGTQLFGGRAHMLVGVEWQDQKAIRDCAEARDWCAESRAMFQNYSGFAQDTSATFTALPGYEGMPARFEMANVRYSQFAPTGTIYHNDANLTSGFRLNAEGTDFEEYAYGFRGGTGGNSINGDGPLVTTGTTMRPSSERQTLFTNFEYNFTERTTGYFQGSYAKTEGLNKNRYTSGTYCVRFNQGGTVGTNAPAGAVWTFGTASGVTSNGVPYAPARSSQLNGTLTAAVQAFLGLATGSTSYTNGNGVGLGNQPETPRRGMAFPFWVPVDLSPNPPTFDFGGNGIGTWVRVSFNSWGPSASFYTAEFSNDFWVLDNIALTTGYDGGTNTVLPARGDNEYAFLNQLSVDAVTQLQNAFGNSPGAGGGAGVDALFGGNPCGGTNNFTAMRKVWNPQLHQFTSQTQERLQFTTGIRGRFGGDWRWEAYYQHGESDSESRQNNVQTNLRMAFAMDAVIDNRETVDGVPNPNFGNPVCRVVRDGAPVLDYQGRPVSSPEDLAALAAGCQPINIFGTNFSDPAAAALQQQAIDYAFVDSVSSGGNSLKMLSLSTNGTLWQGFGSGPITGAFGIEVRQDQVNNAGTSGTGSLYERADLSRVWADGFGGKTRVTEGYTEFNIPIVSGLEGVNLFSLNLGGRYASYYNKGGEGTTRQSRTQDIFNWKVQTVFEPFDWVRLRLSRSQDLRTAGYRDLFINRVRIPDQFSGINPWRERTQSSTENQQERWGQVEVGNINLKPETSNTLTVGMVLSPGGWAQGMRVSADYYNIRVKDGINLPFRGGDPIRTCWEESGNIEDEYFDGEIVTPGVNGNFDLDNPICQEITFATNEDGTRNLQDIITYNSARPENSLPYQRRGIDVSFSYMFPLNRAFETLPGTMSFTVRGSRALESSGIQVQSCVSCDPALGIFGNLYTEVDLIGQIRSSIFIPGVSASPKWTGNITGSYRVGSLTTTLSARYIGGAYLDKSWSDSPDDPTFQNENGDYLAGSVDNNWVKPYMNFSLNGSYDLKVANLKQFQVFGSINNLFDKSPPFTGGGISGASSQYHDIMGRAYRFGVRMRF